MNGLHLNSICVSERDFQALSRVKRLRWDSKTKEYYNVFNFPCSDDYTPYCKTKFGLFRVFNYYFGNPDSGWVGDTFLEDYYAVFRYDARTDSYIQVWDWEDHWCFDRALRAMDDFAYKDPLVEVRSLYRSNINTLGIPTRKKGLGLDSFAVDTPYGRMKVINENIGDIFDADSSKLAIYIYNGVYYTQVSDTFKSTKNIRQNIQYCLEKYARILTNYHDGVYKRSPNPSEEQIASLIINRTRYNPMMVKRSFLMQYAQLLKAGMGSVRSDRVRVYDYRNIPCDFLDSHGIISERFTIINQHIGSSEKCWISEWNNGLFIGDKYAVFRYDETRDCWVQVSMWFSSYEATWKYMYFIVTNRYYSLNLSYKGNTWYWEDWVHL